MDEKKGTLDVLAADEIYRYFRAKRAVTDDAELSKMVKEYEEGNARLETLIQMEGFDADEAVRLSNDMEYIGFYLSQNPKILKLQAASKAMNAYLATIKGAAPFSCGGTCCNCAGKCSNIEEKKDEKA